MAMPETKKQINAICVYPCESKFLPMKEGVKQTVKRANATIDFIACEFRFLLIAQSHNSLHIIEIGCFIQTIPYKVNKIESIAAVTAINGSKKPNGMRIRLAIANMFDFTESQLRSGLVSISISTI
ncbi:MAG: hypothetical protein PHR16_14780 [Methylovulum sp.]|nr:hypothetical protein [Methylovulum sp.]